MRHRCSWLPFWAIRSFVFNLFAGPPLVCSATLTKKLSRYALNTLRCPACRSSSCIKRSCKNSYTCRTSFPSLHSRNPVLPFIDRALKPSVEHFAKRTRETSTRYSAAITDPFSYDLALMPCTLNTSVLGFTQSMLFVPYQNFAEALVFEGSDQTVCI